MHEQKKNRNIGQCMQKHTRSHLDAHWNNAAWIWRNLFNSHKLWKLIGIATLSLSLCVCQTVLTDLFMVMIIFICHLHVKYVKSCVLVGSIRWICVGWFYQMDYNYVAKFSNWIWIKRMLSCVMIQLTFTNYHAAITKITSSKQIDLINSKKSN